MMKKSDLFQDSAAGNIDIKPQAAINAGTTTAQPGYTNATNNAQSAANQSSEMISKDNKIFGPSNLKIESQLSGSGAQ